MQSFENNTDLALVPLTGQTTSYGDRDDGEMGKGLVWQSSERFIDNNDGTVTDNLTKLIWLKNANCPNIASDWETAILEVVPLNAHGTMNGNDAGDTSNNGSHQTDWRLPNVRELQSLMDYGQVNPALPEGHPFTNVQSSHYWSSSTAEGNSTFGWIVDVGGGYVGRYVKTDLCYVWPVRGG